MWTNLPPPILKALIINQICIHWGRRVLTWGNVSSLGVTRSHLGATRPRVGIVKLGLDAPTWQYNDESGARFVFACQGIEPCQANADAGTRLLKKAPM